MRYLLAAVGFLALPGLAGAPAMAANLPPTASGQPVATAPLTVRQTWSAPGMAPERWSERRSTERVELMARQMLAITGSVFAGEDTLGAGTSLTH